MSGAGGVRVLFSEWRGGGFDGFCGWLSVIDGEIGEGGLSIDADGDLLIEAGGDDVQ